MVCHLLISCDTHNDLQSTPFLQLCASCLLVCCKSTCWKHSCKPLDDIVFISAIASTPTVDMHAWKCVLWKTFRRTHSLSPYTCWKMCKISVGDFSKRWMILIFARCSSNASSTFDERERLPLTHTHCLENPLLQTYFFLTTSHVELGH